MEGAVYLGTEQFITLAAVLTVLGTVLVFLAKHQFNQITGGISSNGKKIDEQIEKMDERINRLEEKTEQEITDLRQNMNDLKEEVALTFVQRDEFYRYMNGMEANIKDTNSKVNKILMLMMTGRDGRSNSE